MSSRSNGSRWWRGSAAIHGQSGAEGLSLTISARTVLVAALSAVTIELVFGTYPARRAARLSPMEAIRHE
jgi:ABC-type lipoprotein release transport system permease subunit